MLYYIAWPKPASRTTRHGMLECMGYVVHYPEIRRSGAIGLPEARHLPSWPCLGFSLEGQIIDRVERDDTCEEGMPHGPRIRLEVFHRRVDELRYESDEIFHRSLLVSPGARLVDVVSLPQCIPRQKRPPKSLAVIEP